MSKYIRMIFYFIILHAQTVYCYPANVTPCFSQKQNCTARVLAQIHKAKQRIYVQAYSFTNKKIAQELIKAKERGVDVKVYIDKGRKKEKHSVIDLLEAEGVTVITQTSQNLAHNKIMIIDEDLVITGSFNWTNNAERNEENVNFIKSNELVLVYLNNWKEIVKND